MTISIIKFLRINFFHLFSISLVAVGLLSCAALSVQNTLQTTAEFSDLATLNQDQFAALMKSDTRLKERLVKEIISTSTQERVLSPYTALLVLETEADYARYNIDRQALADIMTVGETGLTVLKRTAADLKATGNSAQLENSNVVPPSQEILMDSDGDGVPDRMDRCPNTPAVFSNEVDFYGCYHRSSNAYIHPCEVHFASGQATLSTHAKVCLESKVETIQEYGLISAEIVAHTDNVGTSAMNRKLSWRRGKAVADFLIKSGVPAQKIFITAVGEKNPMAPNDTRYGRAENRRVEISLEVERTEPSKYRSKNEVAAWTGRYAEFRTLLDKGEVNAAGDLAKKWRQEDLADVLALIALGEWYEKTGNLSQAARAYGSLIDYFPERADIRRWAAERLLAIRAEPWLSIDSLKTALQQRSDHPSGHYLLAIAYWEAEQYQQAVATLQAAQQVDFNSRFSESRRILQETQALMLTQLAQHQQLETWFPGKSIQWQEVTQPQLRFVLMWETDANDVDFHIYDGQRNHAFYQQRTLSTGGDLYADITRGYGPECFRIVEPKTYPYQLQLHYFSRGPMGYGMGILHVLHYDLTAGLKSQFRPFLIMQDAAFVNLGEVTP